MFPQPDLSMLPFPQEIALCAADLSDFTWGYFPGESGGGTGNEDYGFSVLLDDRDFSNGSNLTLWVL